MADTLISSIPNVPGAPDALVDSKAMFKLSYGLFALTAKSAGKDYGCIINTAAQIAQTPLIISIAVNKGNMTHDVIAQAGAFNVSVLTQSTPFAIFEWLGMHSGRNTDKFAEHSGGPRTANEILYLPEYANAVISAQVTQTLDCGTHTLFVADVTQAAVLSNEPSATYQYYFDHIKPKPQLPNERKAGFICRICGYIYEGDVLPADFICPVCKHGAEDFERVE